MSGGSREVPPLRWQTIEERAQKLRQFWSVRDGDDPEFFPIVELIEHALVPLIGLELEIAEDSEMDGLEGASWPDDRIIRLSRRVYDAACEGDGRSRFTLAHELGHVFLHQHVPFGRATHGANVLETFRDSEKQADQFAGCLLMPSAIVLRMAAAEEVVTKCGVSAMAAQTRWNKLRGIKKPRLAGRGF